MHRRIFLHCFQFFALVAMTCAAEDGVDMEAIVARESNRPVEYAMVVVKQARNGKVVQSGATDAKGVFDLVGVPWGEYELVYGLVGAERTGTVSFTIDPQHRSVDLGRLMLAGGDVVHLEKVEVLARQEAFHGSIDRRVYNVGKELQPPAGNDGRCNGSVSANYPVGKCDLFASAAVRQDDRSRTVQDDRSHRAFDMTGLLWVAYNVIAGPINFVLQTTSVLCQPECHSGASCLAGNARDLRRTECSDARRTKALGAQFHGFFSRCISQL